MTTKIETTHLIATILRLMAVCRFISKRISRIEVQKLACFLQVAGEDLGLSFVRYPVAAQEFVEECHDG